MRGREHCYWETYQRGYAGWKSAFEDVWLIQSYDRLEDLNKNCLDQFRKHWQCLENNNQSLWHCRRPEQLLNVCVFEKLVSLRTSTFAIN